MAEGADDTYPELELAPRGASFVRPDVELSYVAWQRDRTMSFNRAANASASFALVVAVGCILLFGSGLPAPVLGIVTVLAATSVGLRFAYQYTRPSAWTLFAVASVNAMFGLGVVVVDAFYFDALELAVGAVVAVAFFGFTLNRSRPPLATVAAATYMTLAGILVGREMARGSIPILRGGLEIGLLVITFVIGVRAALAIDADARHAYRHERIIEAQKATIARERARSEELFRRELSHQVAERSRELGEVLAKSGVTLDVGALKAGERFAERYRIVSALGAGGMGAVYEAERVTDGERLALKAIVGEVNGASAARFAREAQIGASVRHPNLISIVDVGVCSGVPFLVMDLVRGGSLEAQRSRFGDVRWALPILRQIAEGLTSLHEAGVVHRDLKPANVLLAEGGVAKISDFGISRFGAIDGGASVDPGADTMSASPKPRSSELTGTGVVMGTPLYMAPECAKCSRALDASADVFAFGIIAYEMLTGRPPFVVPAFMLAMGEQPIPTPATIDDPCVPLAVARLVVTSLSSDPVARPRVRALAAAFGT